MAARYLTAGEVLALHRLLIEQSGGSSGMRDLHGVESAVAQPQVTFDGAELYPSLPKKAAALGFSLINNHPFVDGNKRVGHAAMEVFLMLNGHEIDANVDDAEELILGVAAGDITRLELDAWLESHIIKKE